MIFYPGETDDELRERLAFFSLVTPAACDFLLEAAEELGDAESVKKACDIAIALLDPVRVINSCGSDCLDYFHALALCPSINDADLAAQLRLLERQPARAKWCTQFWVYHARGDEGSAAYAYEKWLECPRKPDHSSRLFGFFRF
ncbi:hypothetical protein CMUST_06725 [Corynebacterium mustelae]|uniref:Uncharacterized protein n=1 Tax=Corynebacterium mustelae TaxID=571915 RepID=A0A0G3GX19_9CORY|nr:hypothetical protein [Corynebacterium mustelae]AKK05679.1 hypothetical protein CMUST_06725 [Corynebacterium mustelae]